MKILHSGRARLALYYWPVYPLLTNLLMTLFAGGRSYKVYLDQGPLFVTSVCGLMAAGGIVAGLCVKRVVVVADKGTNEFTLIWQAWNGMGQETRTTWPLNSIRKVQLQTTRRLRWDRRHTFISSTLRLVLDNGEKVGLFPRGYVLKRTGKKAGRPIADFLEVEYEELDTHTSDSVRLEQAQERFKQHRK